MKQYLLAVIVSVFVCNAAQAQTMLEAVSMDSKTAAFSQDLNTAKELSGKQIDGIMSGFKADPVHMIGNIQPAEEEEIILSESKKLALKGNVPNPAKAEEKKEYDEQEFFYHMGKSLMYDIVNVASYCSRVGGKIFGSFTGNSNVRAVGETIGAIVGVAISIALMPVLIVRSIYNGITKPPEGSVYDFYL